jgi:hypothetical protein
VTDRRELSRRYKETPPPAGVYRVRDTVTGRYFLSSSVNLPGILNRHRFSLELGRERCRDLQRAWDEHGPGAFAFEVLDTLEPSDDPASDPAEEVRVLEELWRARLAATDGSAWVIR